MLYDSIDSAILVFLRDPGLRGGKVTEKYTYQRVDGTLAFIVLRFEFGDGRGKTFRPIHTSGDQWSIGDPPGKLPLYRLPELDGADRIYVCEGEKAVEAARGIGLCATTSAHGSNSENKTDWSLLVRRDVVILSDNDNAGRAYGSAVARILQGLGCTVRIVELPELPKGGDIVDFIEVHDSRDDDDLRQMIETYVSETPPWKRPVRGNKNLASDPESLAPVQSFDPGLLPKSVRPWIEDIANRSQCPIDFPAVTVMVALAGIVGRKVGVRPKMCDDWTVVPNLWGGVIGRPGVLKTPPLQEVLKPVIQLEINAKEQWENEQAKYKAAELVAKIRRQVAEKKISKEVDAQAALAVAQSVIEQEPEAPIRSRYIANDTTVEKLGELLNQNPNGIILYRDELVGLLRALDRKGQECARAFYLEAWNGTGRFTYDRIGRGTMDIESATVSIIGGIQPGPLTRYLEGAADGGSLDDGLMQRFQLIVWPDVAHDWVNVDEWPDTKARAQAFHIFKRLDGLRPQDVNAERDRNEVGTIPFLRFTADAQNVFNEWRARLERKVRSGDEHPAMESHLAKYRSLIPSLALLIHLADGYSGPIGTAPLQMALRWAGYLESHVRRVYAVGSAGCNVDTELLRFVQLQGGSVTVRKVQRRFSAFRNSAEKARAALNRIADAGLGTWEHRIPGPDGGRPFAVFRLHEDTTTDKTRNSDMA